MPAKVRGVNAATETAATPDPRAIWESLTPAAQSLVANGCAEPPEGGGAARRLTRAGLVHFPWECCAAEEHGYASAWSVRVWRFTDLGRAVAAAGQERS